MQRSCCSCFLRSQWSALLPIHRFPAARRMQPRERWPLLCGWTPPWPHRSSPAGGDSRQCSCATHPEYIWNVRAPSLQDTAASAASVLGVCRAHRPSEQQCCACRSADPVAHGGGRLRPRRLSGRLSRSAVAFTALAACLRWSQLSDAGTLLDRPVGRAALM